MERGGSTVTARQCLEYQQVSVTSKDETITKNINAESTQAVERVVMLQAEEQTCLSSDC
jgi:hypothetical protein